MRAPVWEGRGTGGHGVRNTTAPPIPSCPRGLPREALGASPSGSVGLGTPWGPGHIRITSSPSRMRRPGLGFRPHQSDALFMTPSTIAPAWCTPGVGGGVVRGQRGPRQARVHHCTLHCTASGSGSGGRPRKPGTLPMQSPALRAPHQHAAQSPGCQHRRAEQPPRPGCGLSQPSLTGVVEV